MKIGKVVTPNGTDIITGDSCLLKYGEVGFVVRYNPNCYRALVLTPRGVEWIWRGFLKEVK